ncbi:MAG: murein biosynthesis integral membrane protein MurJ, partial [Candidatus Cloacimonetes bacterium]|nr:murein biosynthesis integral membrane protein MurJ [Candidatus Cloacimonadota bacterium]
MSKKKLVKNIGSMSVAVFISRIFGLLRDIIMTYFFGTSYVADAFQVAYQIPNLLRKLFGEGALSAAFVPIYNEIGIKQDKKSQINFALNVLSLLSTFLLVLCLIGIFLAPLIVRVIAPGFDDKTYLLAMKLTRIMFPYLFLIGLSSTLISVLNSHNYFFIPGLSSAFLNIAMIGCLGIFIFLNEAPTVESKVVIWAYGVILGGILQTIVNFPILWRIG